MEHLVYQPSERQLRSDIRHVKRLLNNPGEAHLARDADSCPPVEPSYKLMSSAPHEFAIIQRSDGETIIGQISSEHVVSVWELEEAVDAGNLCLAHFTLPDQPDDFVLTSIVSVVQSSLYFGLLDIVLKRPLPASLLTREDDSKQSWLYSRYLSALLTFWMNETMSGKDSEENLEGAKSFAIEANGILASLINKLKQNPSANLFTKLQQQLLEIEPPLTALHEAIATLVDYKLKREVRSFNISSLPYTRGPSERLIAKGWCRFVIASAEVAMTSSFLHYLDISGYFETVKGHEACNSEACKRNQVDTESYLPDHYIPGCGCDNIGPNIQHIQEILDSDLIPIVTYDEQTQTLPVGAISPNDFNAAYMAISHVWADGIGSNSEAGLPECQIRRIHQMSLQEGMHDGYFWLDSLCIPKEPIYRKKAILSMNLNYRRAGGAIVLDRSLKQLSMSCPPLHLAWAVYASGWVGRMWTYQEGFLPPWVDLDLSDGLCDLYQLIQKVYRGYYSYSASPFPHIFTRDLLASLQKLRPLDKYNLTRALPRRIVDTFNAMTRRRTSREEDQIIVLGLTLSVDVDKLLKLEGEARFAEFYCSVGQIPWTIVFDKRPKMALKPFRWAPKSWLSGGKDTWLHYDEALATCSQKGLSIKIFVLHVKNPISTHHQNVTIRTADDRYELRSLDAASDSTLKHINIIIVRHFSHQTPQEGIHQNGMTWMTVLVGFLEAAKETELHYERSTRWELRKEPGNVEASGLRPAVLANAEWQESDLVFT